METLAEGYTAVTGVRKVTPGQRRLLLVCYRRHGPRTIPLLRELYAQSGTTVDLLAQLRDHDNEPAQPPAQPAEAPLESALSSNPTDVDETLAKVEWDGGSAPTYQPRLDENGNNVGLNYGPHNRPAFDPSSDVRYDRPQATTVHVDCHDYRRHQAAHRKTSLGWICDVCAPAVAAA